MNRGGEPATVRLEPLHEQLLGVALASPADVRERWDELLRLGDLGRVRDLDSMRLLPLVFYSLRQAGINTPEVVDFKRFALSTTGDNRLLFHRIEAALVTLHSVGAQSIALKGVPLALLYYPQPGLRPMADFDLLIEPDAVEDAISALSRAGWVPEFRFVDDLLARRFEMPFRLPPGKDWILDLHWRLVPWTSREGRPGDRPLWENTRPLVIGEHTTQAPAPHDLLLHVMLHAYRSSWNLVPRWVADVTFIVRKAGADLDWDVFVHRVLAAHLSLPVRDGLTYVAERFDAPVPEGVLAAFAAARTTARERHKHRIGSRQRTGERHWLFGQSHDLRTRWARTTVNMTRSAALGAFAPFLRLRLEVDRLSLLPFTIARRRLQRARERLHAAGGIGQRPA